LNQIWHLLKSHQANGEEAVAAEQTIIDLMHQSKKGTVTKAEKQPIKNQPSKVADTKPQSYHVSSEQSSTDAEMVIEKTASSSTLEFKAKKDETTNDTARLRDASNPSNIQSSSDAISSSSPTVAAADDDKDQTNTATVQSNEQAETTSYNGKNSTDNTSSTMMDHPKNSIADKDSSEKTGHTTGGKGTAQEQDSSTSVSLPQSKSTIQGCQC